MNNLNLLSILIINLFCAMPLIASPTTPYYNINNTLEVAIKKSALKKEFISWVTQEIHALNLLKNNPNIHSTFKSSEFKILLSSTNAPYSYVNKVFRAMAQQINSKEMTIAQAIYGCIQALEFSKKEMTNNYKNIYKNDKNALKIAKNMVFYNSLKSFSSPAKYLERKISEAVLEKANKNNNKNNKPKS